MKKLITAAALGVLALGTAAGPASATTKAPSSSCSNQAAIALALQGGNCNTTQNATNGAKVTQGAVGGTAAAVTLGSNVNAIGGGKNVSQSNSSLADASANNSSRVRQRIRQR